jgi:hypothetical protein
VSAAFQGAKHQTVSAGSVVVALRTADAILIAADSRVDRIDKAGRIQRDNDDACKVFDRNEVVFALAGIAGASSGFDPFAIARSVMTRGRSVKDMAAEFQRRATVALQVELRRWKNDPRETPQGIPGIHYLFAGKDHGTNVLSWASLAGIRRLDGTLIVRTIESGAWPGQRENVLLFGKTAAIDREAHGRIGFRTDAEAMLVAKALINIEAADPVDSQFVGGPIDVVAITSEGIHWPQRKPNCRNAGE